MLYIHDRKKLMSEIGTDLDANINYKVNSELKAMFDEVCKKNQTNMARELKAFMTRVVIDGRLGNGRDVADY